MRSFPSLQTEIEFIHHVEIQIHHLRDIFTEYLIILLKLLC